MDLISSGYNTKKPLTLYVLIVLVNWLGGGFNKKSLIYCDISMSALVQIYQRERGQWAVYYTSPQSFIISWLINFGHFGEF